MVGEGTRSTPIERLSRPWWMLVVACLGPEGELGAAARNITHIDSERKKINLHATLVQYATNRRDRELYILAVSPHDLNGPAEACYPTLATAFSVMYSETWSGKSITQLVAVSPPSPHIPIDSGLCQTPAAHFE